MRWICLEWVLTFQVFHIVIYGKKPRVSRKTCIRSKHFRSQDIDAWASPGRGATSEEWKGLHLTHGPTVLTSSSQSLPKLVNRAKPNG